MDANNMAAPTLNEQLLDGQEDERSSRRHNNSTQYLLTGAACVVAVCALAVALAAFNNGGSSASASVGSSASSTASADKIAVAATASTTHPLCQSTPQMWAACQDLSESLQRLALSNASGQMDTVAQAVGGAASVGSAKTFYGDMQAKTVYYSSNDVSEEEWNFILDPDQCLRKFDTGLCMKLIFYNATNTGKMVLMIPPDMSSSSWRMRRNGWRQADGALEGAASGVAVGAFVGSVVPVVGNAVGGAVGGVVGGVIGYCASAGSHCP